MCEGKSQMDTKVQTWEWMELTVDDRPSSRVDAKVIDPPLEIGHVVLLIRQLRRELLLSVQDQQLPQYLDDKAEGEGGNDGDLLAQRQHVRPNRRHVLLHALPGDLHDILRQPDAAILIGILGLVHAIVRLLGIALDPDGVQ